jgi:outer membrane usher protein
MGARTHLTTAMAVCIAVVSAGAVHAQAGEEIIVSVRANSVARGEFTVIQAPGGDFWVLPEDLPRLQVKPVPGAQRAVGAATYYSLRGLGATALTFDEATLALRLDFPAAQLEPTRLDLSRRPTPLPLTTPPTSTILNYRVSARQVAEDAPVQLRLATDLNVRVGEVLLRQEAKVETGSDLPTFTRGRSQLLWDDRVEGRRVVAGDQLTAGGPFGTIFPGAGVSLTKLFGITPDVLRQPTAAMQVTASTPSQVEVSVDGSTVYRNTVAPGPVSLENLYNYGGTRTVRVTVTDASGRREVYEQPFFFTDTVLAKGMQEYSYFAGKRSELGLDERWRYHETAWQGFHRYGVTNSVTVEAGGEGNEHFSSGGAGVTLRHDTLGLVSLGMLGSVDRVADRSAQGWAARYTYVTPQVTLFAGRRQLDAGFRSFATVASSVGLLSETRLGASARLSPAAGLTLDYTRLRETTGERSNYAVRLASTLNRRTSLYTEFASSRAAGQRDWAFNVYLRYEIEQQQWVGSTYRARRNFREVELEAGRQVEQGEGFGYRVGTTTSRADGQANDFAHGSAIWNLRQATLDFNGSAQVRGGNARFMEAGISGALVGVQGYVAPTRVVNDGFAVARLGVPQAGVDVFLNNQVQGKTNERGELLIPNVGAFGRQDVSLDDKQLSMDYSIARTRVTIAPAYRSGSVVEFGGRKLRALTGFAWLIEDGKRKPVASHTWELGGQDNRLKIETAPSGDFYLEDAPAGRYTGTMSIGGKSYNCRLTIPVFEEAVHELQEGILCE